MAPLLPLSQSPGRQGPELRVPEGQGASTHGWLGAPAPAGGSCLPTDLLHSSGKSILHLPCETAPCAFAVNEFHKDQKLLIAY